MTRTDPTPALAAIDEAACVELLRRLVRTPSHNPPGAEAAVAAVLAERLEAEGLEPELEEISPGRPNLYCRIGDGDGPTILLNGHLDTMPAGGGWTRDPHGATVEDGRLYGLGACDMKAGVAAMTEAVCALRRSRLPLAGSVLLHAVIDEEVSGEGTKRAVAAAEADWALVAEPTELGIVTVGTGQVNFEVAFAGEAAHGSTPAAGVNAIYHAAEFVRQIEAENGALAERPYPRIGPPSYSVGRIDGGLRTSIVPDRCTVGVDRRIVPGESVAAAIADLDRAVARTRESCGADVEYRVEIEYEPLETPEDSAFAAALAKAGRDLLPGGAPFTGMRGTTDAVFIGDAGIPTVVFGPGSMDQAHRPDEFVDLGQLRDATRVIVAALEHLVGRA